MELFEDFEKKLEASVSDGLSDVDQLILDAKSREERWKKRRIGKITSSNLDKLFNFDKKGHVKTKAGIDYLLEIKHQIETGCESQDVYAKAFEWGKEFEEEALAYYNSVTGNNMLSGTSGFDDIVFIDDVLPGFGDSPDGITEDGKGRAEIKCPYNGANHLRNCALEVYHDECDYWYQIMGHLIDPKAEWCDFISYDPRYPDGHPNKMKVIRIWKSDVAAKVSDAAEKIKRWVYMVNNSSIEEIINEA